MMILLKMSIGTNDTTGANFTIREIQVKEGAKTFVGKGTRIDKDKLLRIDTTMFNNGASLFFFTYCWPEQKQEAASLLITACNHRYNELTETYKTLSKSIEILNKSELANYLENAKVKEQV